MLKNTVGVDVSQVASAYYKMAQYLKTKGEQEKYLFNLERAIFFNTIPSNILLYTIEYFKVLK